MNGDGYDDIIIGASNASPFSRSQAGTSYVIFGHSTISTPTIIPGMLLQYLKCYKYLKCYNI